MAVLKVLRYPNPILKKKAKPVKKIDARIRKLIQDMKDTMNSESHKGVGIAAPQVGESLRIFIVDIGEGPIVMINPKIKKKEGEQGFDEGCLSVPGVFGTTKRALKITVEGLNEKWQKVEIEAQGFLAIVFQHEMDHLDGKVFLDRVTDPELIKTAPDRPGRERTI